MSLKPSNLKCRIQLGVNPYIYVLYSLYHRYILNIYTRCSLLRPEQIIKYHYSRLVNSFLRYLLIISGDLGKETAETCSCSRSNKKSYLIPMDLMNNKYNKHFNKNHFQVNITSTVGFIFPQYLYQIVLTGGHTEY